ncbi:hypothetical protein [Endothiovibrio diazotrophicus]
MTEEIGVVSGAGGAVNPLIRPTLGETAAVCCSLLEVLASVELGAEVPWKLGVGLPAALRSVQVALESHPEVAAVVRGFEEADAPSTR